MDLVVEYKYAFSEDLEAYIRRSADETRKLQDTVSQNFNLWRELSTIYGENLKHVLRHDIFENLDKESGLKDKIESAFSEMIGVSNGETGLSAKQRERFEAIFANERIPWERGFDEKKNKPVNSKVDVLGKQMMEMAVANVKFDNDSEKDQLKAEVTEVMSGLEQTAPFTAEFFFQEIVPKVMNIRKGYVFDLSTKLDELFTSDINAISKEVGKYEEIVEVEHKETRMGGEKHKAVEKTAKKRKIRGYFTKTKETANARMGAYLCIAGDKKMWDNPNYFEFVMKDEDTGKCVGLVMLLNIKAKDGKRYLWFGPNPFEGFLGQVSSSQCYNYMYETIAKFADENGFDGVVVPSKDEQILGFCTNRGGDFPDLIKSSRLKDGSGKIKTVEYGEKQSLGKFSGNDYGYEDGALIWDRKAAAMSQSMVA